MHNISPLVVSLLLPKERRPELKSPRRIAGVLSPAALARVVISWSSIASPGWTYCVPTMMHLFSHTIFDIIDSLLVVSMGVTKYYGHCHPPPACLSRLGSLRMMTLWFLRFILSSSSTCSRQSLMINMSCEQALQFILFTSWVRRMKLPLLLMAVHRMLSIFVVVDRVARRRRRRDRGCPFRRTLES